MKSNDYSIVPIVLCVVLLFICLYFVWKQEREIGVITARLEYLKSASTFAQQPKERHYRDALESIYCQIPAGVKINGITRLTDTSFVLFVYKR